MQSDIIIPVWNQYERTRSCIEHIRENTRYPYRLILIDNASDDRTRAYLDDVKKSLPGTSIITNDRNLGFIQAANQGLSVSNAPYVCILNNDTLAGEGWLAELVDFMEKHRQFGLVNPLQNGHKEKGMSVNEYARSLARDRGKFMEMNQCQGFCMLIRRDVINRIGFMEEALGMGGFDDTDYSRRAQSAGFGCACVHSSYVYHEEHVSFRALGDRKKIQSGSEKKYFEKWPRHKRVGIAFSVMRSTTDKELENLLESALFLARDWCWVNLLVFGGSFARKRLDEARRKKAFPAHQNLKFNYLNRNFKMAELTLRILERSFGRKKRKKYDAIFCSEAKLVPFVKALSRRQGSAVSFQDFSKGRIVNS